MDSSGVPKWVALSARLACIVEKRATFWRSKTPKSRYVSLGIHILINLSLVVCNNKHRAVIRKTRKSSETDQNSDTKVSQKLTP